MSHNDRNSEEDSGNSMLSMMTDIKSKNTIRRLAEFLDTQKKETCNLLDNLVVHEQTEHLPLRFEQAVYHGKESQPVQRFPLTLDTLEKVSSLSARISQDKVFFQPTSILDETAKFIRFTIQISSNPPNAEDRLSHTKSFECSQEEKASPQKNALPTNDANGERSFLEMSNYRPQHNQFYANDGSSYLSNEGQDTKSGDAAILEQLEEAAGHTGLGQGAPSQENSSQGFKALLLTTPEKAESFGL